MKDFPGTALGGIGFYPILLTFGPVVTISSDTKMSCELACVSIVRIDSLLFHEILSMRRCFTEFHFALISPRGAWRTSSLVRTAFAPAFLRTGSTLLIYGCHVDRQPDDYPGFLQPACHNNVCELHLAIISEKRCLHPEIALVVSV